MSKKQQKNDKKQEKKLLREKKKEYKKERNIFLKGMKKYEPALIEDILPITAWDKDNYGIMSDGSIVDFMQVTCKNLYNASEDELAYDNLKWDKLFMTYPDDLKYVVLNFPVNISTQLNYIKKIAARTENPVLFNMLQSEYDRLSYIAQKTTDRDYYLMFYAADYVQYRDKKAKLKGILNEGGLPLITEITREKKIQVLYKLNNLNGSIFLEGDED